MPRCAIKWCEKSSSTSSYTKDRISFHKFPKDDIENRQIWIRATHKDNFYPDKNSVVCSTHFAPDCFEALNNEKRRLYRLSVPTLNLPTAMSESPPISELPDAEEAQDQVIEEEYECRTCLSKFTTDEQLHDIFDSWFSPFETTTTIAQDLMRLTSVEVLRTDRHSKLMCARCIARLHNACTFILSVQENEKLQNERSDNLSNGSNWPKPIQVQKNVNQYIVNGDVDCEIKQEIESEEEEETEIVNGLDDYQMEIKVEPEEFMENQPEFFVNGAFSLQNDLDNNTNDNSQPSDVTVKEEPLSEEELESTNGLPSECILCAKQFNCISGLKAHVIANHSYKSVRRKPINQPSPKKPENDHVCVTCRRRFSTPTDLMVHETCHNKVICYGCNEKFDDFKTLLNHRRRCPFSPKSVPKPTKLEDVVRKPINTSATDDNTNSMISCSECSMVFSKIYYYNVHQELHHTSDNDEEISNSPTKPTTPIDIKVLESIFTGE